MTQTTLENPPYSAFKAIPILAGGPDYADERRQKFDNPELVFGLWGWEPDFTVNLRSSGQVDIIPADDPDERDTVYSLDELRVYLIAQWEWKINHCLKSPNKKDNEAAEEIVNNIDWVIERFKELISN